MATTQIITDDEDDLFQEEGSTYNFRELMDQVYSLRDVIFTVPSDQVETLKQGLIVRKSKDNTKSKNAGIAIASEVLSFIAYPAKDKATGKNMEHVMDVRVKLGPKKAVQILDMRVPSDDF